MKQLYICGHSDDTFGCYDMADGKTTGYGEDHDNCNNGSMMAFRLQSGDEGLIVTGQYAPEPIPDGTWVIGVTLLAEDIPLADWPMRWVTEGKLYSPALIIDAPDDVVITDLLLEDTDD